MHACVNFVVCFLGLMLICVYVHHQIHRITRRLAQQRETQQAQTRAEKQQHGEDTIPRKVDISTKHKHRQNVKMTQEKPLTIMKHTEHRNTQPCKRLNTSSKQQQQQRSNRQNNIKH